jgi:hypothetical protein
VKNNALKFLDPYTNRRNTIAPPTHLTSAQVARVLKLSPSRICRLSRPGGDLEAETWYGSKMIPMQLVIKYIRSHE